MIKLTLSKYRYINAKKTLISLGLERDMTLQGLSTLILGNEKNNKMPCLCYI